MQQIKQEVLDILLQLKGSGKFASIHSDDFVFPGLVVEGIGETAFPINPLQANALIQAGHKAPFGKGKATIYDDNVRSAWEIDASKLSFNNPQWTKFIDKAIGKIKTDLGLEDYTVAAHLYKLLVYQKGDFFLPHKDTEKEKGMFGTMIVGLPSQYTGGELVIQFEGVTEVADFTQNPNPYSINYAAFYADCDHEVKPLTSGYRVCLVYNLVQEKAAKKISLQSLQSHVATLSKILTKHQSKQDAQPSIVLLGHQYTPENFSYESLKLNDRVRAEALLQAAKEAGYYAKLCLVTSYLSGTPAYDGYDDDDDENAEMEEVYDESLTIEHWADDEHPALSNVSFAEADLITSFPIDEGEPIVKESTGYMGNYGPDLMHWYHFGAVMIWSHQLNAKLLPSQYTGTQLNWIEHFNRTSSISEEEKVVVDHILTAALTNPKTSYYQKDPTNYNAVADWLINGNKTTFLLNLLPERLHLFFEKIDTESWIKLFKFLSRENGTILFEKLTKALTLSVLEKLLDVLQVMMEDKTLKPLATVQIQKLPKYFKLVYDEYDHRVNAPAFTNLFWTAKHASSTAEWTNEILETLIQKPNRTYIHGTIAPQLLSVKEPSELTHKLLLFCQEYLQQRANNEPQPPASWSRPMPDNFGSHKYQWQILKDFLESPTEQNFDFRKNQTERKELEYAIKSSVVDLKTETIKKGSPHTLRITKTQAAYHRQMNDWNEDVALLEKLKDSKQ
ncbi:2OG-Fe(II) oxygenase family protein [Algoriphagus antarcticus]|uniref:2-oxoglutarate-Fe(II)-dependent oxygenase superfamily protein n=1 Tax=Algoriphagus antarcticus TaxID=238540 RepID=A0A3E0DNX0_9BACT|nr:2OG-Fe(II) oxygenase [Algoriphagus antarcticus]REG84530.1 2-oxoglutarate-Fe(II)-dependent oxygenase superfamily protein [Algoriphagus antarcticus]